MVECAPNWFSAQGLGLRPGTMDGAISISAVQVLLLSFIPLPVVLHL